MDFVTATFTLLLIMDPFGCIVVANNLLRDFDDRRRRRIILRELLIALAILAGFLLAGKPFMQLLGLREGSLSTVGGVVLCVMAFDMIYPRGSRGDAGTSGDSEEPFIVPLATPIIAGPSAVAFLLLLVSSAPDRLGEWFGVLGCAWSVSAAVLLASPTLIRLLGRRGARALERLMGMLLLMIGVQMLFEGAKDLWMS